MHTANRITFNSVGTLCDRRGSFDERSEVETNPLVRLFITLGMHARDERVPHLYLLYK